MTKGLHTVKGVFNWHIGANVAPTDPIRISLDNADFGRNYVVDSFDVFPTGAEALSHTAFSQSATIAVMATRPNGAVAADNGFHSIRGATVADSRQIGWSLITSQQTLNHLDPDHIIVEDLYINAWIVDHNSGAIYLPNQSLCYIIKLRQVKTPIYQAIMALIKERAQDDDSD